MYSNKQTLFLVLIVLAAVSCNTEPPERPSGVPVRTEVAHRSDFAPQLELVGVVRPAETIPIVITQDGILSYPSRFSSGLQTGATVRRGELLAEIRNDRAVSALRQAALQMETADAEFDRARRSYEQGVVSNESYSTAKLHAALAHEAYDAAKKDATRLRVVAGRDGTLVVAQPIAAGVAVSAGKSLAEIASQGLPRVEAMVPAALRASLTAGLPVSAGHEGAKASGRIIEVASVVDANGTCRVVIQLDGGSIPLAGTGVDLQVQLPLRRDALTLPDEAIVAAAEGPVVFVVGAAEGWYGLSRAKKTAITVAGRSNGRVEVVSGLRDGDRVVIAGADALTDNAVISEGEK